MVPHAQMFKNRLQEFAQKKSLPLPVYHTVNDGKDHLPQFKCTVTINGTKYESPPIFRHKKEAQNAAAKEAVEDLQRKGFKFKERKRSNCLLLELASMKNLPPPTYHFTKSVTATVEINGTFYTGAPANNMKKAANKAAFEAICAIDPQYYKHVSEEIEGKQQSSQEDSTESINKRSRIESGNAEQMSQRRKKHKGKKSNRIEPGNAEQMSQRRKMHKEKKSNGTT